MLHSKADTPILFLQGPLGPFFSKFASYLKVHGHTVFKINFNAGDKFFYKENATNYRGDQKDWRAFLHGFILENRIGAIVLYGDCRFYHQEAIKLARKLDLKVMVFEEGYLRPDFITLESNGANNYSEMNFEGMEYYPDHTEKTYRIGNSFLQRMCYASLYYNVSALKRSRFSDYQHHRKLSPLLEGLCWFRSFYRKAFYPIVQKPVLSRMVKQQSGQFYLVPLQVFLDNQVKHHSPYEKISHFIEDVIESFALYAPKDTYLLIKHHPEDRGHVNYRRKIKQAALRLGVEKRVVYVHDLHLPTFLDHARGVVTLNSTVGISSLFHNTPIKTMGQSIMERAELTSDRSLANFWKEPGEVDGQRVRRFRNYLMVHGQVNASFYRDIEKGLPLVYRQFYKLLVENKVDAPELKPAIRDANAEMSLVD